MSDMFDSLKGPHWEVIFQRSFIREQPSAPESEESQEGEEVATTSQPTSVLVGYATPQVTSATVYCDDCKIGCSSEEQLLVHKQGKAHRRAVNYRPSTHCCDLCRKNFMKEEHLAVHLMSYQHHKVLSFEKSRLVTGQIGIQEAYDRAHDLSVAGHALLNQFTHHALGALGKAQDGLEMVLSRGLFLLFRMFGVQTDCEVCWNELAFGLANNVSAPAIYRRILRNHEETVFGNHVETDPHFPATLVVLAKLIWTSFADITSGGCCKTHEFLNTLQSTFLGTGVTAALLNRFFKRPDTCITGQIGNDYVAKGFGEMFRVLLPGAHITKEEFIESAQYARGLTTISTTIERFIMFVVRMVQRIIALIRSTMASSPADVQEWMDRVDALKIITQSNDETQDELKTYSVLSEKLTLDPHLRSTVVDLYTEGISLRQKYQSIEGKKSPVATHIDLKMKIVEKIIGANTGSFVGADKKDKPILMYFTGKPGKGKTVLVDHLFTDVFKILWNTTYLPAVHKYSWNPISPYHDCYKLQPVYEIQDFLQARDKVTRTNELITVLKQADESSYCMNVAFEKKGMIYFQSKFIVLTSNLNLAGNMPVLQECLQEPDAFARRVDLLCEVDRTADAESFDKDLFVFRVMGKDKRVTEMNYNQLVAHIVTMYTTNLQKSQAITNTQDSFSMERINEIQKIINGTSEPNSPVESDNESVSSQEPLPSGSYDLKVNCPSNLSACPDCQLFFTRHYGRIAGVVNLNVSHDATIETTDKHALKHTCTRKCNTPPQLSPAKKLKLIALEATGATEVFTDDEGLPPRPKLASEKRTRRRTKKKSQPSDVEAEKRKEPSSPPVTGEARPTRYRPERDPVFWSDSSSDEEAEGPEPSRAYIANVRRMIELAHPVGGLPGLQAVADLTSTSFVIRHAHGERAYLATKNRFPGHLVFSLDVDFEGVDVVFEESVTTPLELEPIGWGNLVDKLKSLFSRMREFIAFYCSGAAGWIRRKTIDFLSWISGEPNLASHLSVLEFLKKWGTPVALACLGVGASVALYLGLRKTTTTAAGQNEGSSDPKVAVFRENHQSRRARGPRDHNMPRFYSQIKGQMRPIDELEILGQISAESANIMMHNLRPSCGIIQSRHGSVKCFILKEQIIVFTEHLVTDIAEELSAVFPGGKCYNFRLNECDHLHAPDNHLYVANLASIRRFKNYRSMPDLTRYFQESLTLDSRDGFLLVMNSFASSLVPCVKLATNIRDVQDIQVKVPYVAEAYSVSSAVSYNSVTVKGDCGSPLILVGANDLRICGFHCGARDQGLCYAGQVTKDWARDVCAELLDVKGEIEPVDTLYPSPVTYDEPEEEPVEFFQPRTSKLKKSVFYDEATCEYGPAPLKGYFDGKTPAELSFEKNLRTIKFHPPQAFEEQKDWLLAVYGDERATRDILTVEEAIFGNDWIKGIAPDASTGYGWKDFTRKQLIDKDERTIHPLLLQAIEQVHEDLNKGKRPKFFVIDLLKDEKLPIAKISVGKARTFYILPIEINVVLKQFFGAFMQHVTNQHNHAPVKVGFSLKSDDVAALAEYLHLDQDHSFQWLCPDAEASDRTIPFELFMETVVLTNEWYNDQYSEHRLLLARTVFAPRHSVCGMLYTLCQGIPSGAYLTSVYNSLAYAMLYKKAFSILHIPIQSIATFGDDTVITVDKRYRVDAQKVKEAVAEFGVNITAAEKDRQLEWYRAEQVVFLQRQFQKRAGTWFAPMGLRNVTQKMMWFRETAETKKWSLARRAEEILTNSFMEFYQHGEQTFKEKMSYYHPSIDKFQIKLPSYEDYSILFHGAFTPVFAYDDACDPAFGIYEESSLVCEGQAEPALHEKESIITETEPTAETINLTEFVEVQPIEKKDTRDILLKTVDASFEWGPDYSKALERWVQCGSHVLKPSDRTSTPFLRVNPLLSLLKERYIQERFFQARGARFDIEVQIRIVATKFHFGQLMALFRPGHPACAAAFEAERVGADVHLHQRAWGPYDSVYTASMCDHEIIPITSGPPKTMTLKWHFPYNWVNTANVITGAYGGVDVGEIMKFCLFDLYNLIGPEPANLDPPQVMIWTRFTNLRLFGYQDATLVINNVSLVLPDPVIIGQAGPPEYSTFSSTWEYGFHLFEEAASSVVSLGRTFISVLQYFGLSNPRNEHGPSAVTILPLTTATSCGPNQAITVSYRTDDHQESLMTEDQKNELLISNLGAKNMFLEAWTFTNQARVRQIDVTVERALEVFGDSFVLHPALLLREWFHVIRHAIKVTLKFSASSFVNARFLITASPVHDFHPDMFKVSKIVDLQGDIDIELDLPYFEETMYNEKGTMWSVTVGLASDIVSAEETESRPILCTMWVSFPGLEVAIPSTRGSRPKIAYMTTNYRPAVIKGQAGPPLLGKPTDGEVPGLSCSPTSLLHICKRPSTILSTPAPGPTDHSSVRDYNPIRVLPLENSKSSRDVVGVFHAMLQMFRYWHGGMNVVPFDPEATVISECHPFGLGGVPGTTWTDKRIAIVTGGFLLDQQRMFTHIPYRNAAPFCFVPNTIGTGKRTVNLLKYWPAGFCSSARSIVVGAADDFEMFGFMGVPAMRYSELPAKVTNVSEEQTQSVVQEESFLSGS